MSPQQKIKELIAHIREGMKHDTAVQQHYETQPDAAERGFGECICTWCTDSHELLKRIDARPICNDRMNCYHCYPSELNKGDGVCLKQK